MVWARPRVHNRLQVTWIIANHTRLDTSPLKVTPYAMKLPLHFLTPSQTPDLLMLYRVKGVLNGSRLHSDITAERGKSKVKAALKS